MSTKRFYWFAALVCAAGLMSSAASAKGQNKNHKKHKSLDAQATMASIPTVPMTCVFEAEGFADSIIVYDPILRTATVTTGSPAATQVFTEVTVATGLEPYGDGGFSVIAFGDVPLFHVNLKNERECGVMSYFKAASGANLDATWASAPGGPSGVLDAGTCNVEGAQPPPGNHGGHHYSKYSKYFKYWMSKYKKHKKHKSHNKHSKSKHHKWAR